MFHGVADTNMYYRVTFMRLLPLPCTLSSASAFLPLIKDKYSISLHPSLAKRIFFKSQVKNKLFHLSLLVLKSSHVYSPFFLKFGGFSFLY